MSITTRRKDVDYEKISEGHNGQKLDRDEYTVGWICALPIELAAAQVMRDEKHDPICVAEGDTNSYVLGRIAAHGVVIACLPQGTVGTNAAATVATNMARSFHRLRFILLVGIGAGAPDPNNVDIESDIRLGDVVVSKPSVKIGGVIQYDFGKTLQSGLVENEKTLNKPPPILRAAVARLEASHLVEGSTIGSILESIYQDYPRMKKKFQRLEETRDLLFQTEYEHVAGQQDCHLCQSQYVVSRQPRDDPAPVVHYGLIASANQVMRDARTREKMRQELGVICFEMEAAGMMDDCPCLVIRGICDYADSHKNKQWQPYAALTAAAYAKELLQSMEPSSVYSEAVVQITDILRDQVKVAREHVDFTREHHLKQDVRYQDEKHWACHRVFDVSDYERQKNINNDAVPGTCRWVLEHARYRDWLASTKNDLLWISADPGCGKSVLSKSLVDHWLRSSTSKTPEPADIAVVVNASSAPHTICYFFFKDNEEQRGLSTALCALIHQLCTQQPDLIHHALPAFENSREDNLIKKVAELWRIIESIASDAKAQRITCVLDALDECRDGDRQQLVGLLCQFYHGSTSSYRSQARFKWLVTSRPYDDIEEHFSRTVLDMPSIRLRGEDENDQLREEVNLVIDRRVADLGRELKLTNTREREIAQQLRQMENRTYLWLHLVLDTIKVILRRSARPDLVKMPSLPPTVDQAYEDILGRISNDEEKGYARTILTIIIGARRPLTVPEMALAFDVATLPEAPKSRSDLRIDFNSLGDKIRHWCGLFVFISHNRLYLIHQTAKEFLLSHGENADSNFAGWKHCLSPLRVDKEMASICVLFLCLSDFTTHHEDAKHLEQIHGDDSGDNQLQTFFAFASEHWADYTRPIQASLDEQIQSRIHILYDASTGLFAQWTSIVWKVSTYRNDEFAMMPVQLASFLGHHCILRGLLAISPDTIDSEDGTGRTAMLWAAERGYEEVVQTLLAAGADVNAKGEEHGSALQVAAFQGDKKIIKILLDSGADVNAQDGKYGSALQTASEGGNSIIVQMLLDAGADVNAQGGEYGNALQAASEGGHDKIVQILLSAGADVNAQGGVYDSALQAASDGGYTRTVQMLLNAGADVNAQGGEFGNALHAASERGHDEIVQILLDARADANAQGDEHGDALYAASLSGHCSVAQMLLGAGADVNAEGGAYGNALQAASLLGHDKVVQILLDAGADVNAQGGDLGNALQAASLGGVDKVVRILLDAGANVNAQGGEYGNALQAASRGGHEVTVYVLLDAGADVDAQGGEYGSALQAASNGGHKKIVQMLLDAGATVWRDEAIIANSNGRGDKPH